MKGPSRKPKTERSQQTVDAIFEAVRRLLETCKIEELRGSDVCRVAGVSPGTLYQYFGDVGDLVGAWEHREVERSIAEMVQTIERMRAEGAEAEAKGVPAPRNMAEAVSALVHLALRLLRSHLARYRHPAESRWFRRLADRGEALATASQVVAAGLAAHAPRDEIAVQGREELAALAVVHAVSASALLTCDGNDYRELDEEVARMVCAYLLKVPAT